MRFPRMAYTSVAVDASALPSTAGIRACERGTPALSAYQRSLLLLCCDELALHQVHLLLEALDRPFESEPTRLLGSQRLLARGGSLIQPTIEFAQLLQFELERLALARRAVERRGMLCSLRLTRARTVEQARQRTLCIVQRALQLPVPIAALDEVRAVRAEAAHRVDLPHVRQPEEEDLHARAREQVARLRRSLRHLHANRPSPARRSR